jgi:hypothetical protein
MEMGIQYTYALLYVIEGRPHDVDMCTFNTCHRGCNPQPLEWHGEWETFKTPSNPTLELVRHENSNPHHKGIKSHLPWKPSQTYVVLCNLCWYATTTTITTTALIWAIKIIARHVNTIAHRATFILILLFITLVDKLYSSFEVVIRHERKTTITVQHWSSVHGELDVNVT